MNNLYDQNKYELDYIAGDPVGNVDTGITTSQNVRASATTLIKYRDKILECEIYNSGDELMIHLLCPKCMHGLKITNKNKQMDWDGKYISVEPFACTWEMDDQIAAGIITMTNLCNWRVGITKGIAKDT